MVTWELISERQRVTISNKTETHLLSLLSTVLHEHFKFALVNWRPGEFQSSSQTSDHPTLFLPLTLTSSTTSMLALTEETRRSPLKWIHLRQVSLKTFYYRFRVELSPGELPLTQSTSDVFSTLSKVNVQEAAGLDGIRGQVESSWPRPYRHFQSVRGPGSCPK